MIVVVGVSHKTAPIELREQLALSDEAAAALCRQLGQSSEVAEAFVVSTCNRVEVVAVPHDPSRSTECARACSELLCQGRAELQRHTYVREGVHGMRHLVSVAASLDSLVVGEPQILGQLKAGFEIAREQGTVGATLHRAFSAAVRGAKLVRSETSIGAGQVSVPSIAVQLAAQIFGDLRGHRVALIGSGEMGKSVARLFADQGAQLIVLGRSLERVRQVTDDLGGTAALMDELGAVLTSADVVVSSTSAQGAVISASQLKQSWKARRGRNLFLIDLAVPRDIEAKVGDLDGVFLYNIDDLSQVANDSTEARKREAERAALLVDGVVERWQRFLHAEQATPVLKALRVRLKDALQMEMQKSLRGRLKDLDAEQRAALSKLLESGVNRFMHAPTTRIRHEAGRAGFDSVDDVLSTLSDVFELKDVDTSGVGESLAPLPSAPPSSGSGRPERPRADVAPAVLSDDTSAAGPVGPSPHRLVGGGEDVESGNEDSGAAPSGSCAEARFSGA